MKLTTRIVVPVAVGGVLAVGAAAIAWADSGSPSPSPSPSQGQGKADAHRGGRVGAIERRALHGEFTVPQRGSARSGNSGGGNSGGGNVQTMVVDR